MDQHALLQESVLAKFLRYVQIDTQSDPAGVGVPTTSGQWELLHVLQDELQTMGLEDIRLSDYGVLTARLTGNAGDTAVGLLAHVDTSPAISGHAVHPLIHRKYNGDRILLPAGVVVDPNEHPALRMVIGDDIVTSDGSTLLGADDKAGVAEIMSALAWLITHPDMLRATVTVAFTPDEETGRGVEYLDITTLGANVAYTVDGAALGELSAENFYAENLRVSLYGRSAHTGSARGHMINAITVAGRLIAAVPEGMRPETTDGRMGFIHVDHMAGGPESVQMVILLRDFDMVGLERKRSWLLDTLHLLEAGYPGCRVEVERVGGYQNMADGLRAHPDIVSKAVQAMQACGIEAVLSPIRGGTDGARLTERGLPTPNLFAGGMAFHSRSEWIPVSWMEQARDTLIALCRIWAT